MAFIRLSRAYVKFKDKIISPVTILQNQKKIESEVITVQPNSEAKITYEFGDLLLNEEILFHLPEVKANKKTVNKSVSYSKKEQWEYNPFVFQEVGMPAKFAPCKE